MPDEVSNIAPLVPALRRREAEFRLAIVPRLGAGVTGAGCLSVLLVAGALDPAPAGHGTHTQLGPFMTPCAWPYLLDIPCPTCGMTTAFAHAADGNLVASAVAQPFGCLLALATAAGFWAGSYAAVTGSPIGRFFAIMVRPRVLWGVLAIAAAAWGYKIATWPGV